MTSDKSPGLSLGFSWENSEEGFVSVSRISMSQSRYTSARGVDIKLDVGIAVWKYCLVFNRNRTVRMVWHWTLFVPLMPIPRVKSNRSGTHVFERLKQTLFLKSHSCIPSIVLETQQKPEISHISHIIKTRINIEKK